SRDQGIQRGAGSAVHLGPDRRVEPQMGARDRAAALKGGRAMHRIALNPSVVAATLARRGRRHVFADLDPRRTALLVVDLQNAYLDAALDNSFVANALDIVPNVNRIAATLRQTGGLVVWVQNTATADSLDSWSVYNRRMMTKERCDRRF